ncbi:unnamed protein product [Calypogeia fissa]
MENMEGAGFTLAQALHQQMSPVVMVLSTPKAEESCHRNSLSFVDLFRPFCSLGNINVPVRTASEQPYRLTEFNIRMFYASDICQPRPETAEEFLLQVVNDSNDEVSAELDGKAQEAELANLLAEADSRAPAFKKYSREFLRTLAFSEHEAFDHPVACILVVSSSDDSPVNKFVDLYNSDQLPALMNEGAIDPKLLKLYVMLHDNQDGPVDKANELLLEMRSVFGVNHCRVLCINSALPDSREAASQAAGDLWEPYLLRPIVPVAAFETNEVVENQEKGRRGCYINTIDTEELTDFVLDISVKHIIPSMEVKIRTLYQQVSATRKGLKNQIKNLWWRKGKDDVPDVSNGPLYTYSSPESQIRVLADFAFMLHDYELALSTYRLLSSDYKTDKAWKRYAGVQEMIGLSLFMLDQSRKESEMSMDTAINYYPKGGPSSAIYGTRASLWLAEMHKAKSQYREAAAVLSRASTEEASTRSGLLLEQAAYCYLRTTPPMLRKYGFHLVLAGNQYANCFQRKLATQVYRSALSIFGSRDWSYIHDHVYFHLGRLSTLLGNHASAVQFFKKVIACSHQSSANQAKFLAEFLFVIQSTAVQGNNLELDLPTIDVKHVHVHFEDQRTYSSSAAASVPEKIWSSVEEGLVPGSDKIVSTWMDAKSTKRAADFNICVAGEEVGVDVEFSNPLQIPLDVSAVSLVCTFTSQNLTEDPGLSKSKEEIESSILNSPSTSEGGKSQGGNTGDDVTSGFKGDESTHESQLSVSKEEFSLKPGDKFVVRLKVKPLQAGVLKVTGVRWTLSGIATGQCDFAILGPKKRKSRSNQRDEPVPNQRLKFHVLGHMPRLDVSLHEMPTRVNTGEVRRLVLELSNPSTATVKAIKIKTSHPLFLLVGEAGDLDQEFPGCLEVQRESSGLSGIQDAVNMEQECSTSGFTFSFPEGTALEGGSTLLWPLWLHAREAGTISLNTVVYYEPDNSITGLPYRTVRMTHSLQVLPSLKIGVHITPSPLQLQQFLLRLDIENKHPSESFWLRQVSCAGNEWSLAPLSPPVVDSRQEDEAADSVDVRAALLSASVCPSQLLPASQNLSLFFKLLNVGPGKLPSTDGLTSNIKLGPPSSTEPLIDIASGPLPRFLLREKSDQPKPPLPSFLQHQVESGTGKKVSRKSRSDTPPPAAPTDDAEPKRRTVDVILISEQQDGMDTEKREASSLDNVRVLVHDICHCSVQSLVPLIWVMEGPRSVQHDFSKEPFCEVTLLLTVRNCSIYDASVKVETFDTKPVTGAASTSLQEKRVGWFPLTGAPAGGELSSSDSGSGGSLAAVAAILEDEKSGGILSCGPYVWCNLRSTSIPALRAGASAEVPVHVVFFAPGIYDLSRYQISWSLLDQPLDSVKNEPVGKQNASGPQKPSKNTEPTFASGFAPVADKTLGVSSSTLSRSKTSRKFMNGAGQGHPLLLTVLPGEM